MDEAAVSSVVGSVLVVAVAIILISGFSTVVFSTLASETTIAPSGAFAITPRAGDGFVDVSFVSGTPFPASAATFAINANDSHSAGSSFVISGGTDGRLHPGDWVRVNLTTPLSVGDAVALFVVDDETGKSIGSTHALVVGTPQLPGYVSNVPIIVATQQDPTPLTADGIMVVNLSVVVRTTFGLGFVEAVWLNLSPAGGPDSLFLRDDGTNSDSLAGDGIFSGQASVSAFDFAASAGPQTVPIHATVRDVLGHETRDQFMLVLQPPPMTRVVQGAVWRDLPSASRVTHLNLTNFTFRDSSALDDDVVELRVSDLAEPTRGWTARVTFNSTACGGAPGIVSVQFALDGVVGDATASPTNGCFPINRHARLNLIDLSSSLNATNVTQSWTLPGSLATFAFQASGMGPSNQGAVTFLGDSTTHGVERTGFGQSELTWAQAPLGGLVVAENAPRTAVPDPAADLGLYDGPRSPWRTRSTPRGRSSRRARRSTVAGGSLARTDNTRPLSLLEVPRMSARSQIGR